MQNIIYFEYYIILFSREPALNKYFFKFGLIFLLCFNFIFFLLQNHRNDVADITSLLRIELVSDKLMFLLV